jgi:ribonuclease HI
MENNQTKKQVILYTDGACSGNPGVGGYGGILIYGDVQREYSGAEEQTTNNRMELMAAIAGLEALNRSCQVDLYSDSRYLVDAFNQKWIDSWVKNNWNRPKTGPVKNSDLWKRLLAAMEPHDVKFFWVKGHDGHPQNERCDSLATQAADSEDLIEDNGYQAGD